MIYGYIQKLIDYSLAAGLIDSDDTLVIRNQLMDALHVYDWQDDQTDGAPLTIDEILKPLIDHACENGVIEDTASNRDLFDTKLMGIVTPLPRDVIRAFCAHYEQSPEAATDWY